MANFTSIYDLGTTVQFDGNKEGDILGVIFRGDPAAYVVMYQVLPDGGSPPVVIQERAVNVIQRPTKADVIRAVQAAPNDYRMWPDWMKKAQ